MAMGPRGPRAKAALTPRPSSPQWTSFRLLLGRRHRLLPPTGLHGPSVLLQTPGQRPLRQPHPSARTSLPVPCLQIPPHPEPPRGGTSDTTGAFRCLAALGLVEFSPSSSRANSPRERDSWPSSGPRLTWGSPGPASLLLRLVSSQLPRSHHAIL